MFSKISLLAAGVLLVSSAFVEAQQLQLGGGGAGGRLSQDRLNRQYDEGLRTTRPYDDLLGEQRLNVGRDRYQEQPNSNQDRRGDYDREDYSYGYAVRDELSGDIKSQQEVRNGDRVRGQYRTLESDGTERIVDYTADDYRGFNAVVRHQPSVGTRAQLLQTLQPALLVRPVARVGQRQQSASVLLHN